MTETVLSLTLPDEAAMLVFGAQLAKSLDTGAIIYLYGDLGAGKTTLVRGILQAMGHPGAVKSPTYTLVEPYQLAGFEVYHFDLYRLAEPEELEYMGIRDYFHHNSLCLLEWPDKGAGFLPPADLVVEISHLPTGRALHCSAGTETGDEILSRLQESLQQKA